MSIAEKIKALRKQNGYSQEKLAEETGLSLRTIQRVENSETEPRGDTLIRVCKALNVTPDEIMEWDQDEDRGILVGMNLSGLAFLLFPLFGILLPLIFWLNKKSKVKNADHTGRTILNFQITWSLIFFGGFFLHIISVVLNFEQATDISPSLLNISQLYIFVAIMYLINFSLTIFNAYRSYKGKEVAYFLYIPFFS